VATTDKYSHYGEYQVSTEFLDKYMSATEGARDVTYDVLI